MAHGACLLLFTFSACVGPQLVTLVPQDRARIPVDIHACPVGADLPLESGPFHSGDWLLSAEPQALHWEPSDMAVSTAERLGQKEILIRGKGGQHGTAVALLTLFEDGACVINSWGTFLPGETTLSLADRWKGTGLWILLFCLELKREGTPNETRWILLATDGARAWLPLRGGPQIVLPRVSLRPQGQSLYLDAGPEGGPDAVFVLRDDSFEKLK